MPRFTTFRTRRPVCPFQAPPRTRSAKAAIRSSTACTSATTSRPSTAIERPRGARSATWSTARSSVRLIFSPRNIASIRRRTPDSSTSAESSRSVSSSMGFFE